MNHKRYTHYKPSNVDWLGDIPAHWEVRKLRYVANCYPSNVDKHSKENEKQVRLCNYTDVYKNDFITNDMDLMLATATDEQIEKFTLLKNDVIITKDSETADDIAVPALVKEDLENVICGYHLSILRPYETLLGAYLMRALQCKAINIQFEICAHGVTRVGLGMLDIRNVKIPLPPLLEQTAIVTYLNRKLTDIDIFIAKKQRLITLLQEQKAAMINKAVTKGLNEHEDADLRNSGIEWLGKIPKHWDTRRLKYVINGKLQYGANESGGDTTPNNPRYIRITDFNKDGNLKDETFCSLPLELAKPYLLKEGDILFARSGATVGKTFQFKKYNGLACFAGYLIKAEPNPNVILSDYLYYYTLSPTYDIWKNFIFNKATIENIGADKYCNLYIPLPPLAEQIAIVSHIEAESARIDKAISLIERELTLVQEYRTALIAEAVTGKIDCNG